VNRILKLVLLTFCMVSSTCIFASDSLKFSKAQVHFQLTENIGKAVANQPTFPSVKASQLTEFSILRQCNGAESWHQYYNFPETGVTFLFGTLGNKKVLGNVFATFATINFEKKNNKKLVFQKQIGFGFAYFNNPYDIISNRENIVIGSHVTAVASLVLGFKYHVSEFVSVSAGGTYFHFSNAHYQLPNLGLNSLNARIGVTYYPHKKNTQMLSSCTVERNKKFHFNLKIGLGINERGGTLGPSNGPKYPIYLASVFVNKRYSNIANLQVGVEANYNTGSHDYILANDVFKDKVKQKSSTSIFFLGHELLWKKLSFVIQGGVFLYNPLYRELLNQQKTITTKQHLKALFTTKFGFQYYLKDAYKKYKNQVYIGSYVKANLGQADYWETSIGYCF
jgi:Lipid A 3-O-deacylase (PagL)